jgi:hypothetical protein
MNDLWLNGLSIGDPPRDVNNLTVFMVIMNVPNWTLTFVSNTSGNFKLQSTYDNLLEVPAIQQLIDRVDDEGIDWVTFMGRAFGLMIDSRYFSYSLN